MVMDEAHLGAALRYVALNPVRARLAERATDWPQSRTMGSSVHLHLGRVDDDGVTARAPVLDRLPDFAGLLAAGEDEAMSQRLRHAESIGRPVGDDRFLARIERRTGRTLKPGKRGPKPRN